jgi:hypothetical protein
MAAQQQQRVAQANVVAANINSLQRNNTAVMAASMKRGRQSNVSKPQNNSNSLRNDQFKNFNANMLSSNYQLAAATLAAANTQFLQQVVVSSQIRSPRVFLVADGFALFAGSETRDVESSCRSFSRDVLPLRPNQCQLIKIKILIDTKHFDHTLASPAAASRHQTGSKSECRQRKAAVCYLRNLRWLHQGPRPASQPHAVDSQS